MAIPSTLRPATTCLALLVAAALALVLLTGCPSAPAPDPDPDPEAPTVTATVPADGTSDVAVTTLISVAFSLPMNTAATEGALTSVPAIDCAFGWNDTDTTLTCTPNAPLAPDTAYTLNVGTDAESAAGTALASAVDIAFTTAPEVIELCTFGTSTFGACRFGP